MGRIFFVLARVSQILLVFATLRIGTSVLPPNEMAVVFILTSAVAVVSALLINPVGMFMNRRMHVWKESGCLNQYFHLFYLATIGVGLAAIQGGYWVLGSYDALRDRSSITLACLVGASLIGLTVNSTAIAGLNMLGKTREFLVLSVATAAISLASAYGSVRLLGSSAEHWFLGIVIGQTLLAVPAITLFPKSSVGKNTSQVIDKRKIQNLLGFAWPISIAVGLASIQSQGYRLMGGKFVGLNEIGLVAAGVGVSVAIISSVESILSSYLLPAFYRNIRSTSPETQLDAWSAYAQIAIPIYLLTGCYLAIVAPELVGTFMGPAYADAARFVYWGVAAEVCRSIAYTLAMILHAKYNTRALIVPAFLGALTAIGLFLLLAGKFHGLGVGISIAVASMVGAATTLYIVRHDIKNRMSIRFLGLVPLGAAAIAAVAFCVRKTTVGIPPVASNVILLGICGLLYLAALYASTRFAMKISK